MRKSKKYLTCYYHKNKYVKSYRHSVAKDIVTSILKFRDHRICAKMSVYIHIADIPVGITDGEIKKFVEKLEKLPVVLMAVRTLMSY